jgi:chromosome segregation ATPase
MSEIIKNKYLDFSGLRKYDELIKALIASGNKELADAIAALDAKIGSLDIEGSDDKSLTESIANIYASLAEIVEAQDALEGKDAELEGKINEAIADLETLAGSVSKNTEDVSSVTSRVTALEGAIEDLGKIEGGENLATIVSKVNANAVAIETLMGEGDGSLKKVAESAANAAQVAADAATVAGEAQTAANAAVADAAQAKTDAAQAKTDAESAATAAQTAAGSAADAQTSAAAAADSAAAAEAAATTATTDAATAVTTANDAKGAAEQAQTDAATAVADATKAKEDAATAVADAADAKSAIEVLNGEGDGSVKKIAEDAAAEAVAAVVAGAESDFDTLKEVADWIASDKEGSAALQVSVSKNTESINTINGDLDALESKVDGDIANLTAHMSEAATALAEVDGRLDALEAFEETHDSIEVSDIESLFA